VDRDSRFAAIRAGVQVCSCAVVQVCRCAGVRGGVPGQRFLSTTWHAVSPIKQGAKYAANGEWWYAGSQPCKSAEGQKAKWRICRVCRVEPMEQKARRGGTEGGAGIIQSELVRSRAGIHREAQPSFPCLFLSFSFPFISFSCSWSLAPSCSSPRARLLWLNLFASSPPVSLSF
jgi:hypothetical protein